MKSPKVSIGLPVFNGEKFLAQAIESVLCQSFTDFELILCDNASTDHTQEICKQFARQDERVRYHRHETNRGATWNFNRAFELANGEYFNWLAHDDKFAPDYLKKAVAVLDQDPGIVLCHSQVQIIDEHNHTIGHFDIDMRTHSQRASQRFYDLLMVWHNCLPIFGLIRSSALKQTPLIGYYGLGDAVLLARLGLIGQFYKIDEPLFISRSHPNQSNLMFNIWVDHHAYDRWFDPSRETRLRFPQWEVFFDLISMVKDSDLDWRETSFSYLATARWAVRYRKLLLKDLTIALKHQFLSRRGIITASNSTAKH